MIVEKPDLFPDNWIYIHEPSVKVGRIQNFRSWSPEMIPNTTQSCLGLEYFCFEGDGLWAASDDDLIALATKELAQIGLVTADDIKDGCVVRQKKAYPVYDDSYKANVETIRSELADEISVAASGRPQRHAQVQQPGPRHDDGDADRREHQGRQQVFDIWNVNEDAEYHEAGGSGAEQALKSVRMVPRKVGSAA